MDMACKKLTAFYSKELKRLNKNNSKKSIIDLDYFITNLKFIRDQIILSEPLLIDDKENMKIATIATAIKEYKSYTNCITKYFNKENNILVPKVPDKKDELTEQYQKERAFHWNNFWSIVKDNIEDWGFTDDSI